MNTSTANNVTNNERAFRSVFGMGLLTTVTAGTIASPVVIFGTSMIAVYLVMTSIIGSDPVYAAANAVSKTGPTAHDRLMATYTI